MFVDKIPGDDWKLVFDNSLKAVRNLMVDIENLPEGIDAKVRSLYRFFRRTFRFKRRRSKLFKI